MNGRPRTVGPHTSRLFAARRGFTLVEVLLALALMMLVLAAAYSGLVLFQKVTVAGRTDAERSQLARAIERRMAADIRCVLFREEEPEEAEDDTPPEGMTTLSGGGAADDQGGTTSGSGSSGSSAGGSSTGGSGSSGGSSSSSSSSGSSSSSSSSSTSDEDTAPTTPEEAYASQSVGVFGNATTLVLHVARPARESLTTTASTSIALTAATGDVTLPRKSDLRSISYFLAVPGADGMQGAAALAAAGGVMNAMTDRAPQGLARLDGDGLALGQADAAGTTDMTAQQATIVAEEVTELSFRYFDGAAWVAEWNSVALNALPRAIEVTMRIEVGRSKEPTNAFLAAPPQSASDLYRFVVALPLADPTLGLAL